MEKEVAEKINQIEDVYERHVLADFYNKLEDYTLFLYVDAKESCKVYLVYMSQFKKAMNFKIRKFNKFFRMLVNMEIIEHTKQDVYKFLHKKHKGVL